MINIAADSELKQTITAYNAIAKEYANRWLNFREPFWLDLLRKFVSLLPSRSGPVLDAGCGPGRDLKLLKELGVQQLYGIDLSEKMLEIARKVCPEAHLTIMDVRKLKFPENFFAGILCVGVLLHLPPSDFETALREFQRILKPGGAIFLSVKEGKGKRIKPDGRIEYLYSQDFVEDALLSHHFKIVDIDTRSSQKEEHWINVLAKLR